jgi:hypothetical protein
MRRVAIVALLAWLVSPAFAQQAPITRRVTVGQLEQFLSAARGLKDHQLAEQIYDLRLTERLSEAKFAVLEKELPGPQSQIALAAIGDESEFLELPPAELLATPPPDDAAQSALLAKVNDYIDRTLKRLPDFYATRVTEHFEGTDQAIPIKLRDHFYPDLAGYGDQRISALAGTSITVLYRKGDEVLLEGQKPVRAEKTQGLTSEGEFGPYLAWIQGCMAEGKVSWSRWNLESGNLQGVFHFECSGPSLGGWSPEAIYGVGVLVNGIDEAGRPRGFDMLHPPRLVDVDGEITVDPTNGSIWRLAFVEQGQFPDPSSKEGLTEWWGRLVNYSAVEIGGIVYNCPARSVQMVVFPDPEFAKTRDQEKLERKYGLKESPQREYLNESIFEDYHLFRAETKILPGFDASPSSDQSPSVPKR